MAENQWNRRLL